MRVAAITCAIAVAAAGAPATNASVPGPDARRCQVMAFSPDPATATTGICVTLDYPVGSATPDGNATAYLTTDGGQTWQRRRSEGLRPVLASALRQLVFSAAYATDRAVYLHAFGRGVLRTTDGGDTWLPVAPVTDSSKAYRLLTPLPGVSTPVPGVAVAALAFAGDPPALVVPPAHVPVAGAPGFELQFLIDGATTMVASLDSEVSGNTTVGRTRIYSCTAALACAEQLHEFPAGHVWHDGWLAPDFASTGHVYAITEDAERRAYAWRSVARGRGFTRWTSLDAFLRPLVDASGTTVSIAGRPGSRTLYAHISHTPLPLDGRPRLPSPPAPPGEQILRSDDAGSTWRRVAHGLAFGQEGRSGTLPWDARASTVSTAKALTLLPDGRIVVLAASFPTYFGVFTSRDGRAWRRARFAP